MKTDGMLGTCRIRFADVASRQREPAAIPVLVTLLRDSDHRVVAAAADALGHIGPPASRTWARLLELLVDASKPVWVRDTAAYALGTIEARDPAVLAGLQVAAAEGGRQSRSAARSLEHLGVLFGVKVSAQNTKERLTFED